MCVCLFDFDFPSKYKHKVMYLFKKYKLLTLANAAYNALFFSLVFHHFVHYILTILNSCSYWNMLCILFPPALFPHNLLYLKHSLLLVCQVASQSSLEFQLTISSRRLDDVLPLFPQGYSNHWLSDLHGLWIPARPGVGKLLLHGAR